MSIRVLLRDHPNRAIALATESHALIFRHSPTAGDSLQSIRGGRPSSSSPNLAESPAPRCVVEFLKISSVDLTEFRTLTPRPVHGTLGLINIERDVFLCLVTGASRVAKVRPGETVERIYGVEFYCLSSSRWDSFVVDALQNIDPYEIQPRGSDDYSYRDIAKQAEDALAHPCVELNKMLSNGSFYYSTDFDLTNRLQDRSAEATDFDIDNLDESFLWNSYMVGPLVRFRKQLMDHERAELDKSRILTSVIRGFVLTITLPVASDPIRSRASQSSSSGMPSTLTLISRLSCRRTGTRFNSRGIDDDGNVANFVESETLYYSPLGICFSYAQVRGSVPIFWEQQAGLLPGKQNISLTRGKEGTQPAFDKHFEELEKSYGSVHVVNLLSEHKPGEVDLSNRYRWGVQHCSINNRDQRGMGSRDGRGHELLRETSFDFHAETKGPGGFEAASIISQLIEQDADVFAYYLSEELDDVPDEDFGAEKAHQMPQKRSVVVLQQDGVFRTNCLDCLDRTNLIQTIISKMALETFLSHRGQIATQDFWMRHSSLWADNGDALSRIYAGTGALKTSFTRHGKMSIAGAIADARKSATRLYINNFADKGRQNTIDLLLGRILGQHPVYLYDPINDYVTQEMARRLPEYSSKETISIFVGTFNVNGRSQGVEVDLRPWLFPNGDQETGKSMPVMYVIGFQEIVNLSPQQIMNSDPTRKKEWEHVIRKHLNTHMEMLGSTDRYVRLRSGQLVGAALCVYVKNSKLGHISHVEGATKKTGLSGIAGNKGAVAIRMQYAEMGICFITAHLAAGFANYDERNKDFNTINHGLRFQRNRGIDDHETVIWLGDFNYRIGMSNDRVRNLVKLGDLSTLYENDQLNIQMVAGLTFPHYSESKITFLPTYKFDVGTDTYDTSEKARIPAWTDRILRKGKNIRQTCYQCAELHLSDHKPVYATFDVTVNILDEEVRNALSHRLFERRRAEVGGSDALDLSESEEEDLMGFESIEPGLPPASSDRRKWWFDGGAPARSAIQPPAKGMMPNTCRASNPWIETDEKEWFKVPRPSVLVDRDAYNSFQTARSGRPLDPAVVTYPEYPKTATQAAPSPMRKKLPPPYVPVGADRRPPQRQSTSSSMSSAAEMSSKMDSRAAMDTLSAAVPRRKQSDSIFPLPPVTGVSLSSLNSTNASLAVPMSPLTTIPSAGSALTNTTSRDKTDSTSPTEGGVRRKPPPVARKPVNLASKPSPPTKPASLRSPSLSSTSLASPTFPTFNRLSPGRSQSMRSPRSPHNESHGRRTGSTANAATMAALGAFGRSGSNSLPPLQQPIPQGQPGGLFPSPPRRRTAQSASVADVERSDKPTSRLGPAPKFGPRARVPIEAGDKSSRGDYQGARLSLLDAQRILQAGEPSLMEEKEFGDMLPRDKVPPVVPQPRRGGGSSTRNEVEKKPSFPSRPTPPRPDSKKEQFDLLSDGGEQELKGYGVLRPSG